LTRSFGKNHKKHEWFVQFSALYKKEAGMQKIKRFSGSVLLLTFAALFILACTGRVAEDSPEPLLRALELLIEANRQEEAESLLEFCEFRYPDGFEERVAGSRIRSALILAGLGRIEQARELLSAPFQEEGEELTAKILRFRMAEKDEYWELGSNLASKNPSLLDGDELLELSRLALKKKNDAAGTLIRELKKRHGYGLASALMLRQLAMQKGDSIPALCAAAEAALYVKSMTGEVAELRKSDYISPHDDSALFNLFSAFLTEDEERVRFLVPAVKEEPQFQEFPFFRFVVAGCSGDAAGQLLALEPYYRDLPDFYLALYRAAVRMEDGTWLSQRSLEKAVAAAPGSFSARKARTLLWNMCIPEDEGFQGKGYLLLPEESAYLASLPLLDEMPFLIDPLIGMMTLKESRYTLAAQDGLRSALSRPAVRRYVAAKIEEGDIPSSKAHAILLSLF
jgi:hypothetical protein